MFVYHYCLLVEGGRYISAAFESKIMIDSGQSYAVLISMIADDCGCSDEKFIIMSLSLIGTPNDD